VALRRLAVPALAGAALLALAGCGDVMRSDGQPIVVATTTQLADIARNVAGPDAQVVGLLKPNTDPHEYEPRPNDVRATAEASLVLESGQGLDGWMGDVVRQSGADARVLDLGAGMADLHWWQDPAAVERAALRIGAALHEGARAMEAANADAMVRGFTGGRLGCRIRV
jgi:ABC-type Zn uptake system ZnuABC Zn-binding protein ZnuA